MSFTPLMLGPSFRRKGGSVTEIYWLLSFAPGPVQPDTKPAAHLSRGAAGQFSSRYSQRRKGRGRLAVVRLIAVIGVGAAILQEALGDQPGILAKRQFDLAGKFRIVAQEGFCVLPALPEALAVIGEPCTRLLDNASLDAKIDQFACLGDTLAIH